MSDENWNETLVEKKVKYILELEDRIIVVENVPARVSLETGERYFAPETVERLQQMVMRRNNQSQLTTVPNPPSTLHP